MNVYMGKNPNLYIKTDGKGHPGLLIRYHDPKSGLDLGLVAVIILALFSTAFFLYLTFGGDSINWWPLIVAPIGVVIAFDAFKDILQRLRTGIDIRYHVLVEDGVAAFSFYSNVKYLTVSKIGRMWISRKTINGSVREVYIEAYYGGKEIIVFSICEISGLLNGDDDLLLVNIVDYLNLHRNDSSDKKVYQMKSQEKNKMIQAGYRPDYAAGTSLAARDVHPLAPKPLRIRLSIAIALFMFLLYFSPYHSSTARLIEGAVDYISYPSFTLLAVVLIVPFAFYTATKKACSCSCRLSNEGSALLHPMLAAIAGLLLQTLNNLSKEHTGIYMPDLLAIVAMLALMSWITYRGLSGCDCGASKVENQ